MKPTSITWAVICGATVGLIAYDVVAACLWGDGATESAVILHLAHRFPVLPFAVGVLMGHFFASQRAEAQYHAPATASQAFLKLFSPELN